MSEEAAAQTERTCPLQTRGADRRRRHLHALWHGHVVQRRRGPRRAGDPWTVAAHDWHHPQWLAVTIIILLLCCTDAFLTLRLIEHGATEVNPLMRPLVTGSSSRAFALWKFGLTASGVLVLVHAARARAFGRWRVGPLLYLLLAGYVILITYEYALVEALRIDLIP